MKRSKLIVKIIVFALAIYAVISLINLRGRVESRQKELDEVRKRVAEMELLNAELEYQIEHYNDPDVMASIARSNLGLVLPGEIVFYDGGIKQNNTN
jgi:cell division protein FtsB